MVKAALRSTCSAEMVELVRTGDGTVVNAEALERRQRRRRDDVIGIG